MKDISIILPIYQEKDNLHPLMKEIEESFSNSKRTFEVVAVDDGSTDGTVEVLKSLALEKDYLKVILLRRNYGQSTAFSAGFKNARGKYIVTMDSDLQNDPKDIFPMIEKMETEDLDFVSGWRKDRKDNALVRNFPSKVANYIIRKVTRTKINDMGCSLKVYKKEIADGLYLYGEMHRFISVIVENQGFKTGEVIVNHRPRFAGESKYGMIRVFKVILDLIIVWFMRTYQTKSMYIFGGLGMGTLFLSGALATFVLYQKFALGIFAHKNPLFILSVISGVLAFQFIGMGLLSEMLSRTYFESQHKVTYNVREWLNFEEKRSKAA